MGERFAAAGPEDILRRAFGVFARERIALRTRMQVDGMVLFDMAVRIEPAVRAFTIDTGRLPQETYALIDQVRERYGTEVDVYFPTLSGSRILSGRRE